MANTFLIRVGGAPASDELIAKVVTALNEKYKVEYIAPGHCTGEPTFAALKKAFGSRYLYAGLGTSLALGPSIGSDTRRGQGPNFDDFALYRKLASHEER